MRTISDAELKGFQDMLSDEEAPVRAPKKVKAPKAEVLKQGKVVDAPKGREKEVETLLSDKPKKKKRVKAKKKAKKVNLEEEALLGALSASA